MTPETHNQEGAVWYIPRVPVTLADGTIVIRQGQPLLRASARLTSKWTGVTKTTPISPPSGPSQWLFQGPPAESKFLAVHGKIRP